MSKFQIGPIMANKVLFESSNIKDYEIKNKDLMLYLLCQCGSKVTMATSENV